MRPGRDPSRTHAYMCMCIFVYFSTNTHTVCMCTQAANRTQALLQNNTTMQMHLHTQGTALFSFMGHEGGKIY